MNEISQGRASWHRGLSLFALFVSAPGGWLWAQEQAGWQEVLKRLDRLERQNEQLLDEVKQLRQQLQSRAGDTQTPTVAERQDVLEQRTDELAQTKLEAAQKLPIRLTGMALFNAYRNSRYGGVGQQNTSFAFTNPGRAGGGGSLRQSLLGLEYHGAQTLWGGQVHGSLMMDFYSVGNDGTAGYNNLFTPVPRLRTGSVQVDWGSRSVTVGQLKPLISPREPDSLAQVGEPALSWAGNLWFWQPQVRVEQRLHWGERDRFTAQAALFATSEISAQVPTPFAASLERTRPGWQGRFEWAHQWGEDTRIALAPGFHYSATHVAGTSVPSRVFSVDGLLAPIRQLELTGTYFTGQNVASLGALSQGFRVLGQGQAIPIHSEGGWVQLAYQATPRLSFHVYGGEQRDNGNDLGGSGIHRSVSYAGNFYYRLAPNVIFSFEAAKWRTSYLGLGLRQRHHYDLALAYLF